MKKHKRRSSEIVIKTFLRTWVLNLCNGNAISSERKRTLLLIFKHKYRYLRSTSNFNKVYDYFVEKPHINYSKKEAERVINFLNSNSCDLSGNVLDVSGGNGIVLKSLYDNYNLNLAILTEINLKALDFSKSIGLKSFKFDLNKDDIEYICDQSFRTDTSQIENTNLPKFDFVLLRACVMFCINLEKLFIDLRKILKHDGRVIIMDAVEFTLGTALRTQLDPTSYLVLRNKDEITKISTQTGFKVLTCKSECDDSLYAYDLDKKFVWRLLYIFYEYLNLKKLSKNRLFAFPARDRRRSHLILQIVPTDNN